MKIHKKLLLALGILACTQAASATTIYFSGYVNNVVVTSEMGGFAPGATQTGMLLNGTFEYDPAAAVTSSYNSAGADSASYATGLLKLTINNTLHLSTNLSGNPRTRVVNGKAPSSKDEFSFQSSGEDAFTDNIIPAPLGGSYGAEDIILTFKTANTGGLSNTNLPSADALANLFTSRTLLIEYYNGMSVPCSPNYNDFCYASNSYQIFSTITSVSTVPLPPSMFLMGSSLSLLALGKWRRRTV